jgi:DNA-binding MarR family transcriptional regulator
MDDHLPLPSLLSQALVAFTIEFDNEAERNLQHRTTRHGSTSDSQRGPWLVSLIMWSNCMRFVSEEGITVRELERLARTKTNLNGMIRWGYVTVKPDPTDSRPKPPRSGWLIRATPAGRKAQEIWQPLFGIIEKRWQERFGRDEIDRLRQALAGLVGQIDVELPDCLPILGYGLFSSAPSPQRSAPADTVAATSELPLSAVLSKVLLAFALEYERDSEVSLAIGANVLRLAGTEGVRVRDLPRRAGVSKEAIATSLSFLVKRGYAIVKAESPSRMKTLVLNPKGQPSAAWDDRERLAGALWQQHDPHPARAAGAPGRPAQRENLAFASRAGTSRRRMASLRTETRTSPTLPNGSASRRISGRQLIRRIAPLIGNGYDSESWFQWGSNLSVARPRPACSC